MSIVIQNQSHFDRIKTHAEEIGLADNLQGCLDRLLSLAENMKGECHLGYDFAPYSFSFVIIRDDKAVMNGGLIFHGAHDRGGDGGFPSLSVSLSPCNGWQIHT